MVDFNHLSSPNLLAGPTLNDAATEEVVDEGGEGHHDHAQPDLGPNRKKVVVGVAQEKMQGANEAQHADHDKDNVEDDILHRPRDANLNYDWRFKIVLLS